MVRLRPDIAGVPGYRPGKTPPPGGIKLSSNEAGFGPLPGVVEAITEAAKHAHRYPDMFAIELRERIAARHGVTLEQVATGCGSDAVCEGLAMISCQPGDEVLYGWRSFEAYPIMVTRVGAREVRVPLTSDARMDLRAMAAAVTDRTRLIYLCTPNNPTGAVVTRTELQGFLDAVGDDVVVAVDEAYWEFVDDSAVATALEFGDRPNVVTVRTFSKAWGLAGMRCGYVIAPVPIADALRTVTTPFSTSAPAQAAALAALDQEPEMLRRAAITIAERSRVTDALRSHGLPVTPSQGNFVWLPLGSEAADFAAACEKHDILIRLFAGEGVRVTISDPDDNDAFLAAAAQIFA